MNYENEVEVWPDLHVSISLPCGCLDSTKPGLESQLVTCGGHGREWVVSTGEPKTVVTVLIEEVPAALRKATVVVSDDYSKIIGIRKEES